MQKYGEKSIHDQRESHLKFGLKSRKIANFWTLFTLFWPLCKVISCFIFFLHQFWALDSFNDLTHDLDSLTGSKRFFLNHLISGEKIVSNILFNNARLYFNSSMRTYLSGAHHLRGAHLFIIWAVLIRAVLFWSICGRKVKAHYSCKGIDLHNSLKPHIS